MLNRSLIQILTHLLGLTLLLGLFSLIGCTLKIPVEQQVGQRTVARWQALITQNWQGAYSYLSPGYRGVHSLDLYKSRFGNAVHWENIELTKVSCEETLCNVVLNLTFTYTGHVGQMVPGQHKQIIKEKWIKEQDQWWYYIPK
ncbi:hypothetical protein [Candidatus Nitrosacidococcus sp. I8]|uniref:hypothetical protein n=1 Tax=Candidatus Nitrosacidococcus sp. I8 TaxID=2942908 RepID=UPI002226CB49|nr:hypothetical protein [Candidatus Nitrosacidococcus sp. I8]CAH9014813.1 hypothetical protein NURINAE_00108 [Candidatus Nitrosacidococcus sp. I8]